MVFKKIPDNISHRYSLIRTGLADEKADVIPEDRCAPIEEVAGQVDHDRQLSQFLEQLTSLAETNI